MKIAVLGAGVVGISTAWFLAERGHEVVVVDRQDAPGLETSFANGGQISVSHAEPWANPKAPLQVLRWLGKEDAPLLFRLRADPALLAWGARFLVECMPGRTRRNTLDILALALFSRSTLQRLRAELKLEYDQSTRGILHLFLDADSFKAGTHHAHELSARGCAVQVLNRDQCLALEPALKFSREPLIGATYAPGDESGDARKFTLALAERCRQRGVMFRFGVTIEALRRDENRIAAVQVKDAEGTARDLAADAYVACLGSQTPLLTRDVGVRIPVYPVKGYSVTIPIDDPEGAPQVSLTDEAHKIVMSRLGERFRAAGTAEVAGYDLSLNEVRCKAIRDRARAWFPRASDYSQVEYWTGLRPATPGNVPVIGRTRYPNLFLNTGHGTLGWTLASGSGQALAAIVDGEAPGVEFPFMICCPSAGYRFGPHVSGVDAAMRVRNVEDADLASVLAVLERAVREIAAREYAPEPVDAWGDAATLLNGWRERPTGGRTWVCEHDDRIMGIIRVEADGHIELLYVRAECQRRGVASMLFARTLKWAEEMRLRKLYTEASVMARPFFERVGFVALEPERLERRGVPLGNLRMERSCLEPTPRRR